MNEQPEKVLVVDVDPSQRDVLYFIERIKAQAEDQGIDVTGADFSDIERRIIAHIAAERDRAGIVTTEDDLLSEAGAELLDRINSAQRLTGRLNRPLIPEPWPMPPLRADIARQRAADAGFGSEGHTFRPRPRKLPGTARRVAPGLWVNDKPTKTYKGSKAAKKAARMARKRRK